MDRSRIEKRVIQHSFWFLRFVLKFFGCFFLFQVQFKPSKIVLLPSFNHLRIVVARKVIPKYFKQIEGKQHFVIHFTRGFHLVVEFLELICWEHFLLVSDPSFSWRTIRLKLHALLRMPCSFVIFLAELLAIFSVLRHSAE